MICGKSLSIFSHMKPETLVKRLRAYYLKNIRNGVTQKLIADTVGVNRETMNRYLKGHEKPSQRLVLESIERFLEGKNA